MRVENGRMAKALRAVGEETAIVRSHSTEMEAELQLNNVSLGRLRDVERALQTKQEPGTSLAAELQCSDDTHRPVREEDPETDS